MNIDIVFPVMFFAATIVSSSGCQKLDWKEEVFVTDNRKGAIVNGEYNAIASGICELAIEIEPTVSFGTRKRSRKGPYSVVVLGRGYFCEKVRVLSIEAFYGERDHFSISLMGEPASLKLAAPRSEYYIYRFKEDLDLSFNDGSRLVVVVSYSSNDGEISEMVVNMRAKTIVGSQWVPLLTT